MRLAVTDAQLCVGCQCCMFACSRRQGIAGLGQSCIQARSAGGMSRGFQVVVCRACPDPPCARACPEGALEPRPGGGVVFVTPSFRDTEGNEHTVPLGLTARLAGYRRSDPLRNIEYVERFGAPPETVKQSRTGTLRYSRQGQHVTRWIHMLES